MGQETSSIQVLREANVPFTGDQEQLEDEASVQKQEKTSVPPISGRNKLELFEVVFKTYLEQSEGWKKRNLFERQ